MTTSGFPKKESYSKNQVHCKLSSPGVTKKFAAKLAKKFLKRKNAKKAVVFGLTGELGAGKTVFVQGFAHGLGVKSKIMSPTFIILRRHPLKTKKYKNFFHADVYRVGKPGEMKLLNFKEILNDPKNIILVEWADKIKKILPKKTIWINFEHGKKESERIIKIPKF